MPCIVILIAARNIYVCKKKNQVHINKTSFRINDVSSEVIKPRCSINRKLKVERRGPNEGNELTKKKEPCKSKSFLNVKFAGNTESKKKKVGRGEAPEKNIAVNNNNKEIFA